MSLMLHALLHFSILAYALLGGVFLAFSDFIMRALARTGGSGGIEAMQIINREVFRWIFMVLFLGMAPVSLAVAIYAATALSGGPGLLILAGALTYLLGCFAVTIFFNVPMNEALAAMDHGAEATQSYWADTYLPRWTAWNSLRTLACSAAAALTLAGVIWLTRGEMQ